MTLEAEFHKLIKPLLPKKQQGYVMQSFRDAVKKSEWIDVNIMLPTIQFHTESALMTVKTNLGTEIQTTITNDKWLLTEEHIAAGITGITHWKHNP